MILALNSGISEDNNLVAFNLNGTKISVVNKKTKKTIELNQFSYLSNFVFSNDGKYLMSSLFDGTFKYWDLEAGKEIASIISTGYQEYVITTPEQYYMSTKGAADYVHFVKGDKLYGIEQFDLKFNRPDIVLKKMGLGNEKVIEAYHKAYLKRLKKMKLTEEMLSDELNLPEVKIINAEQITPSLDVDALKLNLSIADKKYRLHRINVWINDVALYGANGISLKSINTLSHETSLTLKLKKGINKIQVSVLNVAGAESYKETITVNCTKGKEKPDLYLICIGAGEFTHAEYNLNYAAKDAKDVSEVFKTNKNYGSVFTKTITNKEVTRSNVIKLKELLKTADRNDEVILFYAGHGVLDKNLDYYLSTGDMDFNNPSANGITYETLESILDSIAPLKKVLLIDACHSGEIDKEEVVVSSSQKINSGIKFRNVGSTIEQKESYLGLENTSELSKALFTDLRRGTGATVISSAGGKEYAMESDAWKNGLFTYCLIHGLKDLAADTNKDGKIVLSELQQYLREEVTNLSNGAQKPTSRIENLSMDFKIW